MITLKTKAKDFQKYLAKQIKSPKFKKYYDKYDTTKRGNIINRHHLSYKPEIIVRVFRKEHWIFTYLDRCNPISKGLIRGLRYWIKKNKDRAIKI